MAIELSSAISQASFPMEYLEVCLKRWALTITLALALLVSYLLGSCGVVGAEAMPYGDGQVYAVRAFTLYGYLHSGQWAQFWGLFTLPKQSTLAPPHYWIFFLLPQSWASVTTYGVAQGVATYLLLALGTWGMCRALDRQEWAPVFFLLCASQNLSLEFSFYYFSDVPFFAVGTVALAAQMRAWQQNTLSASILSGALAALMFLVKPANAILFAFTYALAEIVRIGLGIWQAKRGERTRKLAEQNLGRHFAGILIGFIPILLLVMVSGGLFSIMYLVDANETTDLYPTHLDCTGLKRLFYFPLCLTYFYNTFLMALVAMIVGTITLVLLRREKKDPAVVIDRSFPFEGLLPLVVAYLVFGEYFYFGMSTKTMRALLLVLPPLWLLVFWIAERCRIRLAVLSLGMTGYVLCAYAQVFFNAFPATPVQAEGYQLSGDWLMRFPPPITTNQHSVGLTRFLLDYVHHFYPLGGKIAVGSDRLYITSESLTWYEDANLLLHGQPPIYHFNNFLRVDGYYRRPPLSGANGIILYTHQGLQYSQPVFNGTIALLNYAHAQWELRDHLASLIPIQAQENDGSKVDLGWLIYFKTPMTDQQIADAIAATHAPGYAADEEEFAHLHTRHLTWADYLDIFTRWKQKHFGPFKL